MESVPIGSIGKYTDINIIGQHEAVELRDGDKTKWGGKGT